MTAGDWFTLFVLVVGLAALIGGAVWSARRDREPILAYRILQDGNGLFYLQWHRWGTWFYERESVYDGLGSPRTFRSQTDAERFVDDRLNRKLREQRAEERTVVREIRLVQSDLAHRPDPSGDSGGVPAAAVSRV